MRLVVLMRPSVSSTSSSSSRSISDRSVRVATQSDRGVVVVLVVVECAKVHATLVDRRHGVSWEAVLGPQVACVGLAVSGATIDQMSDTHALSSSGVMVMRDRCAVRRAPSGSASACGEPVPSCATCPRIYLLKGEVSVGFEALLPLPARPRRVGKQPGLDSPFRGGRAPP